MNLKLKKPLAVIDLETTGLDVVNDRLIELSVWKIAIDNSSTSRTWRVNPERDIPAESSMIHGIYEEDIKDAPVFREVATEILDFMEGCDIGGYNLHRLDIPVLVDEFLRINKEFKMEGRLVVDVYRIFMLNEGRDLKSAYKFYCKKELENAHSAEADVKATYEVLQSQLDRYPDIQNDMEFLHEYTSTGKFLDSGRRFLVEDGIAKVNFGKHKGKPVAQVLKEEPQYYDWIMKNNFLLDTKQKLTALKLSTKFG